MSDLNPGIRRLVAFLRDHGFNTCDSGDGETRDHECDREAGYVAMTVEPADMVHEARRLRVLLLTNGIPVGPLGTSAEPYVAACFDPSDDTATLELVNVHDRMLQEQK